MYPVIISHTCGNSAHPSLRDSSFYFTRIYWRTVTATSQLSFPPDNLLFSLCSKNVLIILHSGKTGLTRLCHFINVWTKLRRPLKSLSSWNYALLIFMFFLLQDPIWKTENKHIYTLIVHCMFDFGQYFKNQLSNTLLIRC